VTRLVPCLLAAALVASLAACTSTKTTVVDVTNTRTVTGTRTPSTAPAFTPRPVTTVAPLPPGAAPAAGEVEKACPYILSSQDQGDDSMADLEGDRVYRTTVLTKLKPVGCRFYFWAGPFEAIAEIAPRKFATPRAALEAAIATAKVDPDAQTYRELVPGVTAISYRTKFFGPDGNRDWACVFVKGATMVVIRTQRTDTSLNGRLIAQAIAGKF
jgi:hypothetical protein